MERGVEKIKNGEIMEKTKRIDYKALCEAPFNMGSAYEVNFRILVYTGRKAEERPVFRVVIAKGECKVRIGAAGKEFWGIIGLDPGLVYETRVLAKAQLAEG